MFVIDRIADLFAGFYRPDGQMENKLTNVIEHNLSSKLFLEFVISFGPLVWEKFYNNTMIYALFKVPRYVRLFEIDNQIEEILDYMSTSRNVSEIDKIKRYLSFMEFGVSTLINLHLLTCLMIMLCKHRSDYAITWMGARDVPEDD